jgi:hypothetical protein
MWEADRTAVGLFASPSAELPSCDAATSLLYSFLDQTKGAQSP